MPDNAKGGRGGVSPGGAPSKYDLFRYKNKKGRRFRIYQFDFLNFAHQTNCLKGNKMITNALRRSIKAKKIIVVED